MKTIIAGSRKGITNEDVAQAMTKSGWYQSITEVVSGWASGVEGFRPDWDKHGKAAGPIRNSEMADYADALILVWDGKSRGSADMLRKAKAAGLQIFEWIPPRYQNGA